VHDRIRSVLDSYARLSGPAAELEPDSDLARSGLTSHATVQVMLGLEDEFDVEFPDELLVKETFVSIESIADALTLIGVG
jgi:acyl carrier protein